MNTQQDILASVYLDDEILQKTPSDSINFFEEVSMQEDQEAISSSQESSPLISEKIRTGTYAFLRYIWTSACIFLVLLVGTNYKAYSSIAYSLIFSWEMQETQKAIVNSVHAANIDKASSESSQLENTFSQLEDDVMLDARFLKEKHSISRLTHKANTESVIPNIEITPYENRIIIPRIGKNIPLIDIVNTHVDGSDELEDIFMDELEDGVVRYPGSGKPGQWGNAFIFGHSSNFPWMKWNYNDVFALLDHVVYWDEVIVYYNQKKYVYKIYGKEVIRPGNVSVLHSDDKQDSQITLMTCWPIGTTLNRLIVTWDLISVSKG